MLKNATEARIRSKVFSKNLKQQPAAPGTQHMRMPWMNWFKYFRQAVLKVESANLSPRPSCRCSGADTPNSAKSTPKPEQLERFFSEMPRTLKGQGVDGVLTFGYIQQGIIFLVEGLLFDFEDFQLGAHHSRRLGGFLSPFST